MKIETMQLDANAWVPNNPHLPVRVYRSAIEVTGEQGAERFEMLFTDNGWRPDWRDGVYDYHHYHSTAHEALGVFAGTAVLELGGPDGEQIIVTAGDAVMLPAGTGHRCLEASDDFQVVGAYPRGQDWDICRSADDGALARIAALPDPAQDPITGAWGAALSA
ncbi:cupin domain-containing protein [Novosphingobium kaempferiae]|uniref:cupin domain-containing protein n=1 Tax=Novosphingobium kaempferiae TaxID=2896849 RepID=UPI001E5866B9|nr:cupin domain-containing protein [Novosphingobium kaempferiae]